jgi:hypothetical protein
MRTISTVLLMTLVFMPFTIGTSVADNDRGHFQDHSARGHWGGDIRRFHEHDIDRWRGGHWVHDSHRGHLGWWWVVAGIWYFYPTPIYPYPDPYEPPVTVPPPSVYPQFWYYCTSPAGYYPYVPQCSTAWQKVPATPPPSAPLNAPPTSPP